MIFIMADAGAIKVSSHKTEQFNLENDVVLGYKDFWSGNSIPGISLYGQAKTNRSWLKDLKYRHIDTKSDPSVFDKLEDLERIKFTPIITNQPHLNYMLAK